MSITYGSLQNDIPNKQTKKFHPSLFRTQDLTLDMPIVPHNVPIISLIGFVENNKANQCDGNKLK